MTIPSGRSASVELELKDVDNVAFAQDSTVTIKVLSDENLPKIYLLAQSDTTASVLVKDLGRPSDGIFIQRLSGATISEGNNISFQVGAPEVMTAARKIKINYGGLSTANFLTSAPDSLVTIPANLPSVNVSLATSDDSDFDVSGKFDISIARAELPTTANYTVSSTSGSITFTINDNDARDSTITGISIHAVVATVTSEKVARFRLVAPEVLTRPHTFRVHVTQGTDTILDQTQSASNCSWDTINLHVFCNVEIRGNTQFTNFEIELNDNDIDSGSSSTITATIDRALMPITNPRPISTSNKSVVVTVLDDDAPPVIKLEVKSTLTNNSIVESHVDQNIEFEFKVKTDTSAGITTEESASDVTIQYSVVENVGDFLLSSEEGTDKTETLTKNTTSVSFNVSVNGDAVDEINGNFTVTIKPDLDSNDPKTYLVSQVAEENSITINVTDDEIPVLSVDTAKTSTSITEGENLEIVIKSDIAPYQDLDLELCAIEKSSGTITNCERTLSFTDPAPGSFLPSNNAVQNVKFLAKTTENTFPINIVDDDIINEAGAVIVYFNIMTCPATIAAGDTQGFCSTLTSSVTAPITVADDDPEISIAALDSNDSIVDGNGSINEGQMAKFRLTSNQPAPADGIDVKLNITQLEAYLDTTALSFNTATPPVAVLTVAILASQSTADFTLNTNRENINNRSGSITAEIAPSTSDPITYSKDTQFSATINVNDIDINTPEISIAAVSVADGQADPIRENNTVKFQLVSTKVLQQSLNILMCISDGTSHSENTDCTTASGVGDYLTDTILTSVFMPVSATNPPVEFEVELEDDDVIENPGMIHAQVLVADGTTSYRAHSQNSVSVLVRDNDPVMSIAAKAPNYTEGTDTAAVFVVTSNATVTTDTRVRVKLENPTGDFIADGNLGVVFAEFTSSDTEKEKEIMVSLEDDDISEGNGSIIATLDTQGLETANYFIVSDNHPSLRNSASVLIYDDDGGRVLPVVSIEANPSFVTEGASATFIISTQSALPAGITLNVMVNAEEGIGSFFRNSEDIGTHIVPVTTVGNTSSGELIIATKSLPVGTNGSINLTIVADDENYTIGDDDTASILILDRGNINNPVVSISASDNSIQEGHTTTFTFTAEPAPSSDLSVNIKVTQDTDNFILYRVPRTVIIPSGDTTAVLELKTDSNNTNAGSITVEILAGSRYNVGIPFSETVSVSLRDRPITDERVAVVEVAVTAILRALPNLSLGRNSAESTAPILPKVSIGSLTNSVEEGSPVQFIISTSGNVRTNMSILVDVTGSPGKLERDYSISVTLNSIKNREVIELPTINDNYAGDDGFVTARLREGPSYQIESSPIAMIAILDTKDRAKRRNELTTANREVLPNLHHALGVANWSNVSNQIGLAFAGETQPSLILGGQSTMNQILTSNAQAFDNESWSLQSFLGNSSFSFDLVPSGQGNSLGTIWGLGEQQSLSQHENDGDDLWMADVFTAQFGSDVRINDQGLVGLSVSTSDSTIEFGTEESTSIDYNAQNNYLQSYLGWQAPDQNSQLQISTGIGFGEIELNQDNYDPMYLHSTNYLLALKGNSLLYSSPTPNKQMVNNVSIFGDAYFSQLNTSESTGFLDDIQSNASWSQLGLEFANQFDFNPRQSMQLRTSLSGLSKSEEDELNVGLIAQSGFTFTDQLGMLISGTGQLMMYQEQRFFENFGIKGEISFDQGRDGQGVLFSMTPIWNFTESNAVSQLFTKQIVNQTISELLHSDENTKLTSELGYGFTAASGSVTLTPYTGIELSNDANQNLQVGNRISLGTGASFSIENAFKLSDDNFSENELKVSGQIRW